MIKKNNSSICQEMKNTIESQHKESNIESLIRKRSLSVHGILPSVFLSRNQNVGNLKTIKHQTL